jgi:hypothetical protein
LHLQEPQGWLHLGAGEGRLHLVVR